MCDGRITYAGMRLTASQVGILTKEPPPHVLLALRRKFPLVPINGIVWVWQVGVIFPGCHLKEALGMDLPLLYHWCIFAPVYGTAKKR